MTAEKRRRPRTNWAEAFAYYATDPTLTYAAVAKKYGVTEGAVRRHSRPGGDFPESWHERRQAMLLEAQERARGELVESLEQSNREWLLTIAEARSRFRADLAAGKAAVNGRDLAALGRFGQLIRGEATDKVEIAQVNRELGEFVNREVTLFEAFVVGLIEKFVANGKRAAMAGEFRVGLLPLIEQAAAGLSLGPSAEEQDS